MKSMNLNLTEEELSCLAFDYMFVKKKFEKNKKAKKGLVISTVLSLALGAGIIFLAGPFAGVCAIAAVNAGLLPALYLVSDSNKMLFNSIVKGKNITYKEFKQLEKSKNLELLIDKKNEPEKYQGKPLTESLKDNKKYSKVKKLTLRKSDEKQQKTNDEEQGRNQ